MQPSSADSSFELPQFMVIQGSGWSKQGATLRMKIPHKEILSMGHTLRTKYRVLWNASHAARVTHRHSNCEEQWENLAASSLFSGLQEPMSSDQVPMSVGFTKNPYLDGRSVFRQFGEASQDEGNE